MKSSSDLCSVKETSGSPVQAGPSYKAEGWSLRRCKEGAGEHR